MRVGRRSLSFSLSSGVHAGQVRALGRVVVSGCCVGVLAWQCRAGACPPALGSRTRAAAPAAAKLPRLEPTARSLDSRAQGREKIKKQEDRTAANVKFKIGRHRFLDDAASKKRKKTLGARGSGSASRV